jgi:hypothetical protein
MPTNIGQAAFQLGQNDGDQWAELELSGWSCVCRIEIKNL